MKDLIIWNDDLVTEEVLSNLTGQIAEKSKRIYRSDAKVFALWMIEHGLKTTMLQRSHMIAYREYLGNSYAKATAARMLSTARRLLDEQVYASKLEKNPAKGIAGFKVSNETPHTALNRAQAKEFLQAVDRSSIMGKRDYAILMLLLRTGIRRSECAALTIGDIKMEQGHHIAYIQHGKGDKRRIIKLPVDVFRAIDDYQKLTKDKRTSLESPLFLGCTKDHQKSTDKGISDKLIERVVKKYRDAAEVPDLTPHGLRATFNTLAREGGATLEQRQFAMGHSDSRTTQRYDTRKLNLDNNAVDHINI